MLLHRLRTETAQHHHRLEKRLSLFERVQTIPSYVGILGRFYGFHLAFEDAVGKRPEWNELGFPFEPRRKSGLLARDLAVLGSSADDLLSVEAFPRPKLPTFSSFAQVLGCFYVLEGSTLGSRVISKHFEERLGLRRETGLSFYEGYGEQTGRMWKEFCDLLELFAQSAPNAEALDSLSRDATSAARHTFQEIEDWLCESPLSA